MIIEKNISDSTQVRWSRFRFSIVGPLLSAPPASGNLRSCLEDLSKKQWNHPITGDLVSFSVSTLERWLYRARRSSNPVDALRTKTRTDSAITRCLSAKLKDLIREQYQQHPGWSYQLHRDNLVVIAKSYPEIGVVPSYSTIHRYMRVSGLRKRRFVSSCNSNGVQAAKARLEQREVRSYEMEYVHSLWHLDFHHGSRSIPGKDGQWQKPLLLAVLDDYSRLICHAQWYLDETAESLVHGFKQACLKRGLPRALMSDNGAAMVSAEFTGGLERLSILHQPTLPYSPYQNAKQEVFWAQVEGRLMAMLEGHSELTLSLLNEATISWIEFEYHKKLHSEILTTPLQRYLDGKNVGRPCPDLKILDQSFTAQVSRRQRRSDGTFTLDGCRFEVPGRYRHLEVLHIRYRRWDLSSALLIDPGSNIILATLYPQDKSANATGVRRDIAQINNISTQCTTQEMPGMAPLLKDLMAQYAATGLPPAYLPKQEGVK